jgi:Bacterial membrane protein YfhO
MNQQIVKTVFTYLVAPLALLLFSALYFSPAAFNGKTLDQYDVNQAAGTQTEIKNYSAKEGREMLWTNGMFAGMPTFQVYNSGGNTYNFLQLTAYNGMRMFNSITSSYGLLFSGCLGFYFLLLVLGLDWRLSLLGSILYGLNTSNMIWLHAGHVNKVFVLTLLAPTLGGILLIFKRKYIWGAAVTALFTSMQLLANHIQITYYFYLLIGILAIFYLVDAIINKTIPDFAKSIVTLGLAVLLGVLPNAVKLMTTLDYSSSSIRGKSEIASKEKGAGVDGLSKDYAFQYSLGKLESFSLIVPNFMGANSGEFFAQDPESASTKALKNLQSTQKVSEDQLNQIAQATSAYWGEMASAGGAFYIGAGLFFLFVLGFLQLKGIHKWWAVTSLALILMICWGKNFDTFNYLLFDLLPMFNKFRDSKMIVSIAHLFIVAFGMLGLSNFINSTEDRAVKQKQLYIALGITGGLALIAYLYGMMGTLSNEAADADIKNGLPTLYTAMLKDRAALLESDALRSLFYILVSGGLLWFANRSQRTAAFNWAIAIAVIFVCLIDIIGVNKRYLASDDFKEARNQKALTVPRAIDNKINTDKDLSFRVADFSRQSNPFADALPSHFHKSMGGYHAAKIQRYQDLVEKYLINPGEAMNIYGMFNTKYIITRQEKGEVAIPIPEACGNAWFVKSFQTVETAQAELDSLKNLKPKEKAVLQAANAKPLEGFTIQYDSTNTIKMTKYIPDDMTYAYNTKSDQLAIFSEVYYPNGWNLYLDGQKADLPIMKVNYTLRGVKLPSGNHTLEMKFEPESYYKGQTIARIGNILLTLLFAAGLYTLWAENKKKSENVKK